jgi:hypothetical protein
MPGEKRAAHIDTEDAAEDQGREQIDYGEHSGDRGADQSLTDDKRDIQELAAQNGMGDQHIDGTDGSI